MKTSVMIQLIKIQVIFQLIVIGLMVGVLFLEGWDQPLPYVLILAALSFIAGNVVDWRRVKHEQRTRETNDSEVPA